MSVSTTGDHANDHLSWVRTRMTLDRELHEWVRHGLSMIAVGFGSFAIFDGIAGTLIEEAHAESELPRIFAVAVTLVGLAYILLATIHWRKMKAWVDRDAFGLEEAPELPEEERPYVLAVAAMVIGVVSLVALLFLA